MHALPYEIDCTHCGCPDCEVERAPKTGAWFADGVARCSECGHVFSFRAPPEKEQNRDDAPHSVVYTPVKCPHCKSTDVPVQRTVMPVRYHRCRGCGQCFKSVEK